MLVVSVLPVGSLGGGADEWVGSQERTGGLEGAVDVVVDLVLGGADVVRGSPEDTGTPPPPDSGMQAPPTHASPGGQMTPAHERSVHAPPTQVSPGGQITPTHEVSWAAAVRLARRGAGAAVSPKSTMEDRLSCTQLTFYRARGWAVGPVVPPGRN